MTPRPTETLRLSHATLRVSSLEKARAFYADILGFYARQGEGILELATSEEGTALITLLEHPGAQPKPRRAAGLFHLAILFPTRASLAEALSRIATRRYPMQGMSDHAVSEAIYLADPDDNGIELYADRPRETWPKVNGILSMGKEPLDVEDLLATLPSQVSSHVPTDLRLGHIHLNVTALSPAEAFYHNKVGLDVTVRSYPGALFMAADGYHHHLGLNTWMRSDQPAPQDTAGVVDFTFSRRGLYAAQAFTDPDGLKLKIVPF